MPPAKARCISSDDLFARLRDGEVGKFNSYLDIPGKIVRLGFLRRCNQQSIATAN